MSRAPNTEIRLTTGMPVVTMDGKCLGTVKEVRDNFVKVDAPRARDYWLTMAEFLSTDSGRATLVITADAINAYKLSRPGHRAADGSAAASVGSRDLIDHDIMQRR